MNMNSEKILEHLNTLVQVNQDRIEGYKAAYKEVEDFDLKALFSRLRITSEECKRELEVEITRLGGASEKGTSVGGKFYRAWMDIKSALTGRNRTAILNSCEFGEDQAIETYEAVLKENRQSFTAYEITMLNSHLDLIKADHDEIRALRDMSHETA